MKLEELFEAMDVIVPYKLVKSDNNDDVYYFLVNDLNIRLVVFKHQIDKLKIYHLMFVTAKKGQQYTTNATGDEKTRTVLSLGATLMDIIHKHYNDYDAFYAQPTDDVLITKEKKRNFYSRLMFNYVKKHGGYPGSYPSHGTPSFLYLAKRDIADKDVEKMIPILINDKFE